MSPVLLSVSAAFLLLSLMLSSMYLQKSSVNSRENGVMLSAKSEKDFVSSNESLYKFSPIKMRRLQCRI